MGSCNRCKRKVCTKKREGVSVVEGRKRRGERVHKGAVAKEIHSAVKVTTNGASILCREERWKKVDGTGLQVSE